MENLRYTLPLKIAPYALRLFALVEVIELPACTSDLLREDESLEKLNGV